MATYALTVTTSANDEKGLAFALAQINAERAARTPPLDPLTAQTYLQRVIDGVVTDYKRQYKQDLRERVGAALDTATNAQVTQVATVLGVTE